MKWIWHMCWANLKQRGVRTVLTILGVVIGVISIVSLMAVGLGVKKELLRMTDAEGGAREIQIYGETDGKRKDRMLTDRSLQAVEELEGVAAVYPVLSVSAEFTYENYTGYWTIDGMPQAYLDQLETANGNQPETGKFVPELIMGNQTLDLFYNTVTGTSYGEMREADGDDTLPDLSGQQLETTIAWDDMSVQTRLTVADMTKESSYAIYCSQEDLKLYLRRLAAGGTIPGQPVNQNGENYSEWIYSSAIVEAEDMDAVEGIVKSLQDMGYQAESNQEFVAYIQKAVKITQLVLAAIGMIALVVAVIGIGNTMTTAVYDRLPDIGILKVLGSDPEELLGLFLLESAMLGGMGGLVGLLASYGITELLVNRLAVSLLGLAKGTTLAVIPWWLAAAALVGAVLLGMAAGFFPARWAAGLKPIEAVRR